MNPMPELAPMLKRLRLSGVLESLPARNQEAIQNKLAYTEFLALLVQDEVGRREHKKFDLRVRRAGFRGEKTLERFDWSFNPRIDRALIQDLGTCRFIEEKVAVLIAGPCGTGKSHIAQALGHLAVREGYDVLFTTQTRLLGNLHAARATGTYERRFQAFARAPLLIVDDFGLKPMVPPHDEDFHDLIAERYENAATVVTSNLLCGAPHKRFNAESHVMRGWVALQRMCSLRLDPFQTGTTPHYHDLLPMKGGDHALQVLPFSRTRRRPALWLFGAPGRELRPGTLAGRIRGDHRPEAPPSRGAPALLGRSK